MYRKQHLLSGYHLQNNFGWVYNVSDTVGRGGFDRIQIQIQTWDYFIVRSKALSYSHFA